MDRKLLVVDVYPGENPSATSNGTLNKSQIIHHPSNPFAADLMNESFDPEEKPSASVQLSAEERSELFADTGCTQNAMIAVMGYNPQDDKRICKFYDPATGGCFKGGKCRLEHVAKLEGN